MNPKSGTEVTPTLPDEPRQAEDADSADPGEVAEREAQPAQSEQGEYGSTQVEGGDGADESQAEQPKKTLSFELQDTSGNPIAEEPYRVTLPDGSTREGRTGADGMVVIEGVDDGDCDVDFPRITGTEWDRS